MTRPPMPPMAEGWAAPAAAPAAGGAKGADGRKRRAEIVKKVMQERGLKLIEASKFVKANNLYKA